MPAFEMGVNYWPRRSAMYMWQRFDLGEIREDMARIKALGLDIVRFFLLWEAFQPSPDRIDPDALRRFDQLMQAIADAQLLAMPTLFCGHMSGVNWLPAWSLDPNTPHGRFRTIANGNVSPYGIGDFYADPKLLQAQELFAATVGERAKGSPALYCWDLGNEFSNLREPAKPEDAAQWSARLTYVLQKTSNGAVTGGMHGEDVERDRHIRPSSIAAPWTIATMHGYSVYSTFSRGRLDYDVVPFYERLMQSFSGKPTLFSEYGNPTCPPGMQSPYDRVPLPGEPALTAKDLPPNAAPYACLTEDEMAKYAQEVTDRLHACGALGAMWWCWADYAQSLADLPPFDSAVHELHFGMVRNDGTYKPVAQVLERIAKECRPVLPAPPPLIDEAEYYSKLPKGLHELYRACCARV